MPEALREEVLGMRVIPVDPALRQSQAITLKGKLNDLDRQLFRASLERDPDTRRRRVRAIMEQRKALDDSGKACGSGGPSVSRGVVAAGRPSPPPTPPVPAALRRDR